MNNTEADLEILLAATRYEKIRKLSAGEYSRIWNDCLANEIHFDDAIDALPEPFRVKMREGFKTCESCKHWGDDIERKTESFDASTRECKEIFKRLTDCNDLEGYLPFFDSLATPATFGCNEYGKAKDGL